MHCAAALSAERAALESWLVVTWRAAAVQACPKWRPQPHTQMHATFAGEVSQRGSMRTLVIPEDCPPVVAAMQQQCLLRDPAQRPSAAEIVDVLRREATALRLSRGDGRCQAPRSSDSRSGSGAGEAADGSSPLPKPVLRGVVLAPHNIPSPLLLGAASLPAEVAPPQPEPLVWQVEYRPDRTPADAPQHPPQQPRQQQPQQPQQELEMAPLQPAAPTEPQLPDCSGLAAPTAATLAGSPAAAKPQHAHTPQFQPTAGAATPFSEAAVQSASGDDISSSGHSGGQTHGHGVPLTLRTSPPRLSTPVEALSTPMARSCEPPPRMSVGTELGEVRLSLVRPSDECSGSQQGAAPRQ